jgi:hypothetical protein
MASSNYGTLFVFAELTSVTRSNSCQWNQLMFRMLFVVHLLSVLFLQTYAAARADDPSIECVSEWFEVKSFAGGPSPERVLALCEDTRSELFRVWVERTDAVSWQPRCKINLHPTRAHYLRKVGLGAGQTSGCSSIQMHAGKVVLREIDLLLDHAGELTALPHELTHVLLADLLRGRQPHHWLDEGIAMLADTEAKQKLHVRDCHEAMLSGNAMTTSQILALQSFSSPDQMPAFYGQSLLLVKMLANQSSPARIIRFANDSLDHGTEAALRSHYKINGVNELERAARTFAFQQVSSQTPLTIVSLRFKP